MEFPGAAPCGFLLGFVQLTHHGSHPLTPLDPVLYERLVKRFQGVEERNREGKEKGYGRVLEADLLRGEARLAGIQPAQHRQARWDDDIGEGPWHQQAVTSEQGLQLWRHFLQERFVRGGDDDFDYGPVDDDEDLDVMEHREREEAWFEAEEPRWHAERQGETGIQDF